VVRNYG